uniref:Putative c2h2-type zn-finger protein n=1 Tax=Culex tarsalis TaxID=7177 RepID=A0A1Q3EVH4_CULTA
MDIDLETLANYGFIFDDVDDDLQQVDPLDIVQPVDACASVLDELIGEYLSGSDSQSSFGGQSSAAAVSPTSSEEDLSVPEDAKPNTYQELFNMNYDYGESEVVEVKNYLPQQQFFDVIQLVSTEACSSNLVPVASFIVDSNGLLHACDPKPSVTTRHTKKRGRKPLPRPKVIPGENYCGHCDKNFKSKRGLLQHVNTHHRGVKPISCGQCGKRFDLVEDMLKHRDRHLADNKPYGCKTAGCGKRFMYQSDLDRHVGLKHGKAPFSCPICGKGFGRKDHVEKHEISHLNNTVKKQ